MRRAATKILLALLGPPILCCTLVAAAAAPMDISAKVVYVDDGDTLNVLLADHRQMKVRLASIDAPEIAHTNKERGRVGQPFSDKAQIFLASLTKGKQVRAKCFEKDRFERDVCEIFVDEVSVNRQMVEAGWAWANQASNGRYLRDKSLLEAESRARAQGRGLWRGRAPIPPWEWRRACWVEGRCDGGL